MSTANLSFLRHFRMRFDIFFRTDAIHIIFMRNPMDRIVTLAGYGSPIYPGNPSFLESPLLNFPRYLHIFVVIHCKLCYNSNTVLHVFSCSEFEKNFFSFLPTG